MSIAFTPKINNSLKDLSGIRNGGNMALIPHVPRLTITLLLFWHATETLCLLEGGFMLESLRLT